MEDNKDFKILDCTVRDGGYLNNWEYDIKFVKELYRALSKSGIDFFEIGFRSTEKYFDPKQYGPWRFTPESLISEVTQGLSSIPIALMVDYGKMEIDEIPDRKDSLAAMYRVAVNQNMVLEAIEFCNKLSEKGYITCIQLMGIVNYSDDSFIEIIKPLRDSLITYVYFADSYGSLLPSDIRYYIDRFSITGKKIGFHPHNNMQLSFANTLEAIKYGIDIVDGTVFGMGRGAGNLPTEILLSHLENRTQNDQYNTLPVLDIIDRFMVDLKNKFPWGYDLPYMLSGMFKVHPYYSKTIVDYREFSIEDITRALETIRSMKPIGFKKELLESIIRSGFIGSIDTTNTPEKKIDNIPDSVLEDRKPVSYKDSHVDKDFLILANGPTLKQYKKQIDEFINEYQPVVIGSNYLGDLFIPDYHAFSNKKRFIDYVDTVDSNSKLLISSSFAKDFIEKYCKRGFEIIQHLPGFQRPFNIVDGVITSNCRTIGILSIAIAIAMGARKIYIAGMDGYKQIESFSGNSHHFYTEVGEPTDFEVLMARHNWNEQLLKQIEEYLVASGKEGLSIVTPTSHKFFYKSIDIFIGGKDNA